MANQDNHSIANGKFLVAKGNSGTNVTSMRDQIKSVES
jgi:hypothetical protein